MFFSKIRSRDAPKTISLSLAMYKGHPCQVSDTSIEYFPWEPVFQHQWPVLQIFHFLIIFSFIMSVNADHELESAQELLRRSVERRNEAKKIPEVPIERCCGDQTILCW